MTYSRLIFLGYYDGFTEGYFEEHPSGEPFYFKVQERNYELEDECCYHFWKVDSTFQSILDILPEDCQPQGSHKNLFDAQGVKQLLDQHKKKVHSQRIVTDDTTLEHHEK